MAKSERRRVIEEVRPPTLPEICVHEAGHAIVQLTGGSTPWIDHIEVDRPNGEMLGVVWSKAMWQPWMKDEPAPLWVVEQRRVMAARDVVNYLAGNIAEFRFRGRSRAEIRGGCFEMADQCLAEPVGSRTDYGLARNRLEWITPDAERRGFVHAWLACETVAASWWKEILHLAGELERRGRIDDDRLYPMWNQMRDARGQRVLQSTRQAADWLPGFASGDARTHP